MRSIVAAFAFLMIASPAAAEVANSSPSGFLLRAETELTAAPAAVWRDLTRIERWWGPEHTYSGDAGNLRLAPRAGGCWCERWEGGSIEHARVVLAMESDGVRTLRLAGGLGPLQELGASGVLTFTVAPHAGGTKLTMTYRVAGETGLGLDRIAPLVDGVMMEQFGRLARYSGESSRD
jgi:uncharacterized protein YndB with AHSA1/START domain